MTPSDRSKRGSGTSSSAKGSSRKARPGAASSQPSTVKKGKRGPRTAAGRAEHLEQTPPPLQVRLDDVDAEVPGATPPVVAEEVAGPSHPTLGGVVRPYGDATGDGMIQLSFTLPVANDKRAEGAALQLAAKLGLDPVLVVHRKAMGPDFTFFVVYGRTHHLVELDKVSVVERDYELLSPKEVTARIKAHLRRPLVVVGACIGTDAHTVGIDAILNVKGWAGEKGLEAYSEVTVHNLGSQVSIPDLVAAAQDHRADAVLVSQVVTQRDAHVQNISQMSAAFREAYPAGSRPLLVIGGPRFDESWTERLGVDHIFGRGTTPNEVASYLVHALLPAGPTKPAPGRAATASATSRTSPGSTAAPGKTSRAAAEPARSRPAGTGGKTAADKKTGARRKTGTGRGRKKGHA
jgi:beta-lysine 5,6-aminomutase beta subunit